MLLNQPFKIRRLGHFGFNLTNMEDGRAFLRRSARLQISDVMDYSRRAKARRKSPASATPTVISPATAGITTPWCCFPSACATRWDGRAPGITINQITWQVGSWREVGNAIKWFNESGIKQQRSGRDMPGSNWHTYLSRSRWPEQRALLRHRADRLERP